MSHDTGKVRYVAEEVSLAVGQAKTGRTFYLWANSVEDGGTDDKRTMAQVVPAKFMALGVEQRAKAYLEDFTNATAGVFVKRPYAITRWSGI